MRRNRVVKVGIAGTVLELRGTRSTSFARSRVDDRFVCRAAAGCARRGRILLEKPISSRLAPSHPVPTLVASDHSSSSATLKCSWRWGRTPSVARSVAIGIVKRSLRTFRSIERPPIDKRLISFAARLSVALSRNTPMCLTLTGMTVCSTTCAELSVGAVATASSAASEKATTPAVKSSPHIECTNTQRDCSRRRRRRRFCKRRPTGLLHRQSEPARQSLEVRVPQTGLPRELCREMSSTDMRAETSLEFDERWKFDDK